MCYVPVTQRVESQDPCMCCWQKSRAWGCPYPACSIHTQCCYCQEILLLQLNQETSQGMWEPVVLLVSNGNSSSWIGQVVDERVELQDLLVYIFCILLPPCLEFLKPVLLLTEPHLLIAAFSLLWGLRGYSLAQCQKAGLPLLCGLRCCSLAHCQKADLSRKILSPCEKLS